MNRKLLAGVVALVVVLGLGAGAAYYTGFGPAPGGPSSGEQLTDFPTATPAADGSDAGDGGSTATATATGPPFSFTIDGIEDCGLTCRDVTATLRNNQDAPATDVTVFSRVYAGQDSTDSADLLWEGKEEVGTLEAGAAYTSTRRVELSLQEAQTIEQQGGWVTIVTTVQTDQRTVTFRDSEQVA